MKCRTFVRVSLLPFIGVALSNRPALAQSINIDYGDGAGTPPAAYAAAGSPGIWNVLAGPSGTPETLVGLDGSSIPATVTLTSGAGGATAMFDHPATSGGDEDLLDDYTSGGTDAVGSILFSGLDNGLYEVIVYAWTPGDADVFTAVWKDCSDIISQLIGGTWPGQLEDDITQARFTKTVVDGTMQICTAGGLFWEGAINGIQLVALECNDGSGGVCTLPADVGPCEGICARFYYNTCTERCEPFIWGCCQGNANNFETVEACQAACPSACDVDEDCADGNPCTDDSCSPEGQCFNVANFDPVSTCCNPSNGLLSVIECDDTQCYDPICFAMGCTCCDRPDGDPCAEPMTIPTASNWAVAIMALLFVTMGSLAIRRAPRLPLRSSGGDYGS